MAKSAASFLLLQRIQEEATDAVQVVSRPYSGPGLPVGVSPVVFRTINNTVVYNRHKRGVKQKKPEQKNRYI